MSRGDGPAPRAAVLHPRLMAMMMAARYFGLELDPNEFRNAPGETTPGAAALSDWAKNAGMWSRALRLRWRHLMNLSNTGPVVLLFNDGTAGLLTGANPEAKVVALKDPRAPEADPPIMVDEMRLAEVWSGETILIRTERGGAEVDPPFTIGWLFRMVMQEKKSLKDLFVASLALSFLTIVPPLLVMSVTDKVITHHSYATLFLISVILTIMVAYETLLGFARRLIIAVVGVRTDAKLNLHVFARLIRLPLDFFERHPAGETMYKVSQIHQVRNFITGKLMTTLLDMITLAVLLPFLFWLNATLAWIVLVCSTAVLLIILAYLRPMRVVYGRVITAETDKQSALGETIFGVKTVKSLALEPQRKALWDERVAEAGKWRLAFSKLSNWPQTLVTPIERFMWMGIVMVGAYLALIDDTGFQVGSLFAFMMLSQRVSQPLVGLARLIRLPLDFFERHPAGETMYKVSQIHQVRNFITGKLMTTLLDMITLFVLLPFLFWLNATLAWIVLVCSTAVLLIILAYLRPMRVVYGKVVQAETNKQSALGETIFGVKTVKSLALEPQRKALWDERVAEAGKWRLAFSKLANWPQTLVTPIERFMWMGIVMVGAYLALVDETGFQVGSLFAFMMLSQRVSQPLVGLARLIEEWEEVGGAMAQAADALNRPLEVDAASGGIRPKFAGAITFEDVTFTYAGTKVPALDKVSFSIPAGTMLGLVGRSGSGKSTVTRLLQGINREYSGFVKIDGSDLREINLRHLRSSFGTVLQENFLFRGSIRDNILAGRPGLTLEDAIRAARLAGAEEFIERMASGYDTYIEEGSPNLSGGQRQRLAIARALITDPRILILDEATSALDPESEALVNANLARIARGRTMVVVSHRLSSLVDCDQIMVLDKGKVVDIAPHATLLERCTVYRQLWAQQNRHMDKQGPRHATLAPNLLHGN